MYVLILHYLLHLAEQYIMLPCIVWNNKHSLEHDHYRRTDTDILVAWQKLHWLTIKKSGHKVCRKSGLGYTSDGAVLYIKESLELNQFSELKLSMNSMKSIYKKNTYEGELLQYWVYINSFLSKKVTLSATQWRGSKRSWKQEMW